MNKRKENLIKSLKIVIDALKKNQVEYEWKEQSSCNCGLVAQAILGVSQMKLKYDINDLFSGENIRTWKV